MRPRSSAGCSTTPRARYSLAAGRRAKALHNGTFVLSDDQDDDFASAANRQFLLRFAGGVGINKNNPATTLDVRGTVTATAFAGNGAALTALDAGQVAAGTLADARLSANIPRLNGNSTFTGANTFSGANAFSNAANSFTGNGANLTSLNASSLASGTVADARLSSNVALLNAGATFSGTLSATGDLVGARLNVGSNHSLTASYASITGGRQNAVGAIYASIGGGISNTIASASEAGFLGGGNGNALQANCTNAVIAGGRQNAVGSVCASIAGGVSNTVSWGAPWASIGGGMLNSIKDEAYASTIAGGALNSIGTNASGSTIGGGWENSIQTYVHNGVICGGYNNTIQSWSDWGFIGGGQDNFMEPSTLFCVIGGGYHNANQAAAEYATVPGGYYNYASGNYSFAAGRQAKAYHTGAFVWADSQAADFASVTNDEFVMRAQNGVRIATGGAGLKVDGKLIGGVNSVYSTNIVDGEVKNADLADGAVSNTKLLDNAVSNTKLLDNAVSTTKLQDGAVTSAKIQDGAITSADLAPDTSSLQKISLTNLTVYNSRVGVGTTTPGTLIANTKLEVAGGHIVVANNYGCLSVNSVGSGIGAGFDTTSDDQLAFYANGAEKVRVSTNGNVGIGTNAPGFKLEIIGDLRATGDVRAARLNIGSAHALSGTLATIAGGELNTNAGQWGAIGGGAQNTIQSSANASAIPGGAFNVIQTLSDYCAIGGGCLNSIQASADYVTIGGGMKNTNQSIFGTISGGATNSIGTSADWGVVAGGSGNSIGSSAYASALGGGQANAIASNARYATVPGGYQNTAGADYSFAAGRQAKANHQGCFVWADSTAANFASTATDQFLIRAANGVGINNNNPATELDVNGTVTAVAFNPTSDRNAKERFSAVDPREVLDKVAALPISRWNFKAEPAASHLGPMAQDFHAAFGVGADDKHIATVDADGVALAAIQGLNQKVEQQRAELQQKQTEIAELKHRLERLETLLSSKLGRRQ